MWAYVHARGPQPDEIKAARLINRFGAQAVYGRTLGYREMQRVMLAEHIEYIARKWQGKDAAKWFKDHPDDLKTLLWAQKAYHDGNR